MVAGGRLQCLACFFELRVVLLLWLCLCDVEASTCPQVIDKKVGDTVELPSCSTSKDITLASWKFGQSLIATTSLSPDDEQFKSRLKLNRTTFSLQIKDLTLQDSGEFSFQSEGKDSQRPTITITLRVHESIAKLPTLKRNSTWDPLKNVCNVYFECHGTPDINISYKWTVGNQTINKPVLLHDIRVEDGDTKFTCTIYNSVSHMSASETLKCSGKNEEINPAGEGSNDLIFILSVVGGAFVAVLIITVITVCYWKRGNSGQTADSDLKDQTVYEEISEVVAEAGTSFVMKPSSPYETIANAGPPVTPGPQTIYDKVQLSRISKAPVSPYKVIH